MPFFRPTFDPKLVSFVEDLSKRGFDIPGIAVRAGINESSVRWILRGVH